MHKDATTYFASYIDKVTIGYFFDNLENVASPIINTKPYVLFSSSISSL
jgi:hypothetical protein